MQQIFKLWSKNSRLEAGLLKNKQPMVVWRQACLKTTSLDFWYDTQTSKLLWNPGSNGARPQVRLRLANSAALMGGLVRQRTHVCLEIRKSNPDPTHP